MSRPVWIRIFVALLLAIAALLLIRLHVANGAPAQDSISTGLKRG